MSTTEASTASGLDLKVERVRARATVTQLASEMGVSRQRVSQVEAMPVVNPTLAARYRQAILQLAEPTQKPAGAA